MSNSFRGWTFTHWWVRPVVKIWFGIYHKSVTYSGLQHLDWEKPMIFAPSHHNAFSDALCLILPTAYRNNGFIYPLIRADAFGQNAALSWMLKTFHMMPVYRLRDRVNVREKNQDIFANCYEVLSQRRNLLIQPEGNCIPKKNVGSFKKGAARIALRAEHKNHFNLDVQLVPVGVNYSNILEPRKGIHINIGEPLSASDYEEAYSEHPALAINSLNRNLQKRVKGVTVDIADNESYSLTNKLITLFGDDTSSFTQGDFSQDKSIADAVSNSGRDDGLVTELKNDWESLSSLLIKHNLDYELSLTKDRSRSVIVLQGLAFVLLLPILLYGWINNILPWVGMREVGKRIREKQFKSSAAMVAGLLFFPVCYLLQSALVGWFFDSWTVTLGYFFSLPVSGLFTLSSWESFKSWRQNLRLWKMGEEGHSQLKRLLKKIKSRLSI